MTRYYGVWIDRFQRAGRNTAKLARVEEGLNARAFFRIEKDAVGAHQLEAVPRGRIVTGGDNDRTLGIECRDHQLGSGRGTRAYINDAAARLAQSSGRSFGKSRSRRARVASEDDGITRRQGGAKGRGKAGDNFIGERLADEAANPRNADDERSIRHNFFFFRAFRRQE